MRRTPLAAILTILATPLVAQQHIASTGEAANSNQRVEAIPPRASATAAIAIRAPQAPLIDGKDNDPVWQNAQIIDQFLQFDPKEGVETRFKTEAKIAFDDRNFYAFIRMYDPAPDSIVSALARRDVRVQSEQVKIIIDSYFDKRTGYEFAVNPAGVKRDYYLYGDGQEEDVSWDAVWDVATTIDKQGWTAEYRIPLSQLRFAHTPENTFGIMIFRDIARTGERTSWPLLRRSVNGVVSQEATLTGLRNLASPRRLEVMPYSVAKTYNQASGDHFAQRGQVTGGADIKYGLSSNLTLDATINPDFGQVEADPATLNLSAFETFFGERRPFFLEGTGIFNFNVQCGDIDSGCTGLFYSRRIGREPTYRGAVGNYEENPSATSILGATKLTGRLGNGLSVGVLEALTAKEEAAHSDTIIEPQANYFVGRLQQDFRGGNSGIGVMATAVNRNNDPFTSIALVDQAYAAGVDARHRFWKNNYIIQAYVGGSSLRGDTAAIRRRQTNSVHYFQRPDGEYDFDPTRTSLSGDAERISFSKFGGDFTRFQTVYQRFSPGFDINDAGYLRRADETMFRNWFAFQGNSPNKFYRRAFLNLNTFQTWNDAGLPTNLGFNSNVHGQFHNQWWFHLGGNLNNQIGPTWDDRATRGGPAVRRSPDQNMWGGLEFDQRWKAIPFVWFNFWRGDEGRTHGFNVSPQVDFRVASRLRMSLGSSLTLSKDYSQWNGNFADTSASVGTTHYTFAQLKQQTLSSTVRVDYTATPTLSLQLYASPFVTVGDYSDWKELADARTTSLAKRFRPFGQQGDPGGFNYKQFNSNTVVRWEYRPGSTLFLVWSQGRQDYLGVSDRTLDVNRDYKELFSVHPTNTFLVKASYWFNF